MADLPFDLPNAVLAGRLLRSLDVEGKVPRAIEALGPVGGREVILLGGGIARAAQLEALGATVRVSVDGAGQAGSGGLGTGGAARSMARTPAPTPLSRSGPVFARPA